LNLKTLFVYARGMEKTNNTSELESNVFPGEETGHSPSKLTMTCPLEY